MNKSFRILQFSPPREDTPRGEVPPPSEESLRILQQTPPEIWHKIALDIDWSTLFYFCQASNQFKEICSIDIWKEKIKKDFGKEYLQHYYVNAFHDYLRARVNFLYNQMEHIQAETKLLNPQDLSKDNYAILKNLQRGNVSTIRKSDLRNIATQINSLSETQIELADYDSLTKAQLAGRILNYFRAWSNFIQKLSTLAIEANNISLILSNYLHATAPEEFQVVLVSRKELHEILTDPSAYYLAAHNILVSSGEKRNEKRYYYVNEKYAILPLKESNFDLEMRNLGILPAIYSKLYTGFPK